jgi:two-component system cell cycle response regulator
MDSEQFEKYQQFTESTIHSLSEKVTMLEKKLDMFSYLLEISKYINQYIKDPNLIPLINDMLIGVFGANRSTIYIKSCDGTLEAASENVSEVGIEEEKKLIIQYQEEEFIINSEKPIFDEQSYPDEIHSCIGVPVKVDYRLIGFILIQHKDINYFSKYQAVFLALIGNHIGVAIENNSLYKKIKESACRDGLTELFNKSYFFETLNNIPNLPELNYAIVIIDLDKFKAINDTYGHPMGDLVLKTVSKIIQSSARSNDIVSRYGGDEMIIYMQNFTDKEKVRSRIESIRDKIENTKISYENTTITVTVSIGVYVKIGETLSLDEVIKKADEVLYISKKTGRNRVTIG